MIIGLFLPVLLVGSVAAQPLDVSKGGSESDILQLFTSIDRRVATIGESILFTVEVLASPRGDAEKARLREAFLALEPPLPENDIKLVRKYKPVEVEERIDLERLDRPDLELRVFHMRRRFVLKPTNDGLLEIPSVSITFRDRKFESPVHELHVYRLQADFLVAQRAVVPLVVESRMAGRYRRRFVGTGSAFLVAEDALVTAYHVVVDADRITATLPNGHRVRIKKVWTVDPQRDVAVLYIDPGEVRKAKLTSLRIAPREPVLPDEHSTEQDRVVFTTGWPSGIQQSGAGVLFGGRQYYDDDAIWLSSNRVRPGDSGGPLLDRNGSVVGVVSYGMSSNPTGIQILDNVSTATDPRPALARRFLVRHPTGLGAFRNEEFFDRDPEARAVKIMAMLTDFSHLRHGSDLPKVDLFLNELNSAVEQSLDTPRLHFLKGSIYQMLGDFDEARDAYEEALARRSEHYPAAYSLAYCQLALRSYEAAADLFDFTTHFEPYRDLAEYGLVQAEMQLLRYDEAIHHLKRIIHHHEDFVPAVYLLGRAYVGKGNDRAAARILVKLEEMNPGWGKLLDRSIRLSPFRPVRREILGRAKVRRIDQFLHDRSSS